MQAMLIRSELQHGSENRYSERLLLGAGMPARQTIESGLHGIGVGVERIVDQCERRFGLGDGGHRHTMRADARHVG